MRGSNFTNLHCTNTVILSAIWCRECSMVVSLVFFRFYNDQESIAISTRVFRAAKLKNASDRMQWEWKWGGLQWVCDDLWRNPLWIQTSLNKLLLEIWERCNKMTKKVLKKFISFILQLRSIYIILVSQPLGNLKWER